MLKFVTHMPVKKNKIAFDADLVCVIIGIVTPLKDYRICWFINQCFLLDLIKTEPVVIENISEFKQSSFSRFKYEEELTKSVFYVLENKSGGDYLISETRQADYLFIIKGTYYQQHIDKIISKLKEIEEVQAVVQIKQGSIKNKSNILFYDDEKRR